MEFAQLLESRRSIRNYKSGMRISEDQIKVMIDAAIQAPTWKNSQTGRYYVAMSEDKINFVCKRQNLFDGSMWMDRDTYFEAVRPDQFNKAVRIIGAFNMESDHVGTGFCKRLNELFGIREH